LVREFFRLRFWRQVFLEVRGKEVLIRRALEPTSFVDDFCSLIDKKLREKVDLERLLEGEVEERFALHWPKCFHIPIIYDEKSLRRLGGLGELLLKISSGEVEACTSCVTWDEMVWIVRKLFGPDLSLKLGRKFLSFSEP
jgi:hypothetical protein